LINLDGEPEPKNHFAVAFIQSGIEAGTDRMRIAAWPAGDGRGRGPPPVGPMVGPIARPHSGSSIPYRIPKIFSISLKKGSGLAKFFTGMAGIGG
jgi:hypothetical protein